MQYTKLFHSITDSTIWCEPDRTRLVWIAMLAMADWHGRVEASIPGLANRARVPVEDCRTAIDTFLAPDRDSRNSANEGRRIEVLPEGGGWRLLNYPHYRDLIDTGQRRERMRQYMRQYRQKKKKKDMVQISADHVEIVQNSTKKPK